MLADIVLPSLDMMRKLSRLLIWCKFQVFEGLAFSQDIRTSG